MDEQQPLEPIVAQGQQMSESVLDHSAEQASDVGNKIDQLDNSLINSPNEVQTDTSNIDDKIDDQTENSTIRVLGSNLCMDHFDFGVTLGTGSFGRVKIAVHRVSALSTYHQVYLI